MADSRFFPWFKLELEALPAMPTANATPSEVTRLTTEATKLAAAIKTLLPIDRNFYEADIKVVMRYALVGNTFEITIVGLDPTVHDVIEERKTSIKISLGYLAGMNKQVVLEGVIQSKSIKAGEHFYETTLKGIEKGYYLLQETCLSKNVKFGKDADIRDILSKIKEESKVELHLDPEGSILDAKILRDWSFDKKSALYGLKSVQRRLQQMDDGYSLLMRDGKIWYGKASDGKNNAGELINDPIYSYDNYLVSTDPVNEQRGGRNSGTCTKPKKTDSSPSGYDFEMLGDPNLRPGDTVTFKLKIKENSQEVPKSLTIESITHDFSREKGYRCTGRVLDKETFLKNVFSSMAPSAESTGEEVNNLLARNQERFPAVNVCDITDYTPQEHLVNAMMGLQFEPTMTSPSIQVRQGAKGFTLERRPIVAPFAWNLCGLVVPVYPGMRAAAVHNRFMREDALLNGFIWTEEMTPPPNEVGDYWLCLPLDVPSDRPPNDNDKAANDLITSDGKRVLQLKGLRLTIGEGLLPTLGSRPSNVGTDDELQIEHSSGAKITMKANEIKLEAGERTLTLASGKVSVT